MLSFRTSILSPISFESSSTKGLICLQGPHHSAQKSTSTGLSDFRTSCSKLLSVTGLLISRVSLGYGRSQPTADRKSTRLNSSHVKISYAVFCLKKKKPKEAACGLDSTRSASTTPSRRHAP